MNRGLSVSGWKEAGRVHSGCELPRARPAGLAPSPTLPSIRSLAVGSATTGWALSSTLYMDLLPRGT